LQPFPLHGRVGIGGPPPVVGQSPKPPESPTEPGSGLETAGTQELRHPPHKEQERISQGAIAYLMDKGKAPFGRV
jgi:hypothetical protein